VLTPRDIPPGFSACYEGTSCYFDTYVQDTHFKIHDAGANMPFTTCATACINSANCEAFETMSNGLAPSCTFWMNGACDISKGSPPGHVNPGMITDKRSMTFCEKPRERNAFSRRCTLGLPLAMLSTLVMAAVMG